ncbi:hypothetical protein TSAR_015653 [Trichomalopsis sarcophagae]|uniref:SMB domain-containing protein n=1 Tax=Trichomalopsis sarcophagae TaxID=543379 RepID=A0A232FIW5_9HYME|nr:hypothetical protein TSAR_015653 [Trichomalopsis sarcophagae]
MKKSPASSLALLLLASSLYIGYVSAGSCAESKLCCPGRDSACVVQKTSPNAIIQSLSDKPCYCDHACLKLGDCCDDFKEACGGEFSFLIYLNSCRLYGLALRGIPSISRCYCVVFTNEIKTVHAKFARNRETSAEKFKSNLSRAENIRH